MSLFLQRVAVKRGLLLVETHSLTLSFSFVPKINPAAAALLPLLETNLIYQLQEF